MALAAVQATMPPLNIAPRTNKTELHDILVCWALEAMQLGNDDSRIEQRVKDTIEQHNTGAISAASLLRKQKRAAFVDDSPDSAVKRSRGSGSRAAQRDGAIRYNMMCKRRSRKWTRKDAAVAKRTKARVASIMAKARSELARQASSSIVDDEEEDDSNDDSEDVSEDDSDDDSEDVSEDDSDDDWETKYATDDE